MTVWTPEKIEELRQFVEVQKRRTRIVADHFGISRNAIIGACHRYKIPMPQQRPGVSSKWTVERISKIKGLHAEGLPVRDIAGKVGLSKSSVQAKLVQLGLAKPPGQGFSRVRRKPMFMRETPSPTPPLNIPFIDLEPHHCRSITENDGLGNALFCGHQVIHESSYCRWHHSIFYTKPEPRKPSLFRLAA